MKLITSFLFVMFLSLFAYSGESQDNKWIYFCSKDEKFSIELPTPAKRSHFIQYLYEIYRPKDSGAEFPYVIVVLNNPTTIVNLEEISTEQIAEWKNTMEIRLSWLISLIKPNLVIEKSDFIIVDDSPALDCEMSNTKGESFFARMLMVGNRIYFLGASLEKNSPKTFDSTYKRFIDSFKAVR